MQIKNDEIFRIALELEHLDDSFSTLPINILFPILKNKSLLENAALDIQNTRDIIVNSNLSEDEKKERMQQLSNIVQNIPITTISLSSFPEGTVLPVNALDSIMFMIIDNDTKEETENGTE